MRPWDRLVEQAPPRKPLGMLQRGRGAGYLWALSAPPKEAHPIVVQAICWDARWDRLMEKRASYFARLANDLSLDLSPVERHVFENDSGCDPLEHKGRKSGLLHIAPIVDLPLQVIAHLVAAGNGQAIEIARRYALRGLFWEDILVTAAQIGGAKAVQGFDEVIATRLADEATKKKEQWKIDVHLEPWRTWLTQRASPLHPLLRTCEEEDAKRRSAWRTEAERKKADHRERSTDELLEFANGGVLEELVQRRSESDIQVMLAAIRPDGGRRAAAAICALGEQLDARMIEPTARTIEADPKESLICIQAAAFLRRFPAELVLPLARKWFVSRSSSARHVARGILWDHATADDVPIVIPRLRKKVTPKNLRTVIDALRIVSRFAGRGPFKEVQRHFTAIPSSRGRAAAARALSVTDPSFATGLAYECLWDCESDARHVGCTAIDLGVKGAKARLGTLATDPREQDDVKQAAAARL